VENRQVSSGGYSNAEEFLTALIEQEQERQAKQNVNAMLRSTLKKNKTVEATNEWWQYFSVKPKTGRLGMSLE
jgi:hypothetical protein